MKPIIIFVYSGKGGVGKSTIAVNLAYSFKDVKIGLFDADIESPSVPSLLSGLKFSKQISFEDMSIKPAVIEGIKVSSTGYIGDKSENVYLSGRTLEGALEQLLYNIDWGIDVLIIDLPPGTGEIHRNLFSKLKGEVILVTTPQEVSFLDTQRGIDYLNRMDVEILGVIENMGNYECSNCGHEGRIFSADTENQFLNPNKLNLLASIPLLIDLSDSSGITPFVLKYPNHEISKLFKHVAAEILKRNLINTELVKET